MKIRTKDYIVSQDRNNTIHIEEKATGCKSSIENNEKLSKKELTRYANNFQKFTETFDLDKYLNTIGGNG